MFIRRFKYSKYNETNIPYCFSIIENTFSVLATHNGIFITVSIKSEIRFDATVTGSDEPIV